MTSQRDEQTDKTTEADMENLRQRLLDEVSAGAFTGLPAMVLEEDEIRQADMAELLEIAKRYGF